jgi:diaminohydroxyphosphoribosylaminopyrimidine deaminase/5-amino-6-(5-phosphoribosylamino)uracil reductase
MLRAIADARRGEGLVEPNPMVGAVIVREDVQVGLGFHEVFGGPHAEVNALRAAGEAARGGTLYVSLEPCCHDGKTPPCTEAILNAGVGRVVVAARDPFPAVSGQGIERLRAAGVTVTLGTEEAAARRLLGPYLKRITTGRPFVTGKWAMTADGKIATAEGKSRWISNESSREEVHALRRRVDAVVVGVETVIADDPLLTPRPPGPRTVVRIVLDSSARIPMESRLVRTTKEAPVWIAVTERAPVPRLERLRELGCEILRFESPNHVPLTALLNELGRRDFTNLLVEGGGRVLGSFLNEDQIDAVQIYIAPVIEGGDHSHTPVRGRGSHSIAESIRLVHTRWHELAGDGVLTGLFPRPWLVPVEPHGGPDPP